MAKIYNSDLTKGIAKNAGIQQSVEKVPNELAEKVVPVMETNPELLRKVNIVANINKTTTGSGTIYTTLANKQFYLTSAYGTYVKDAAADVGQTGYCLSMGGVIDGANIIILSLPSLALTAETEVISQTFNPPINVDRGSTISLGGATFTAGTMSRTCGITGYYDEIPNA
jgi:hypothetical protein